MPQEAIRNPKRGLAHRAAAEHWRSNQTRCGLSTRYMADRVDVETTDKADRCKRCWPEGETFAHWPTQTDDGAGTPLAHSPGPDVATRMPAPSSPTHGLDRGAVIKAIATATDHVLDWDTSEETGEPVAGCASCADWGYPCRVLNKAADAVLATAVDLGSEQAVLRVAEVLGDRESVIKMDAARIILAALREMGADQ